MRKLLLASMLAGLSVASQAIIFEFESNNTTGTANLITRGASPWADVGQLSLNPAGDNDYFMFTLFAGETLTAITTPMQTQFFDPDTMMHLLDPGLVEVAFNDDANSLGSAIRYTALTSGTYYLGITGFNDRNFVGNHTEFGDYVLTMSSVPEPATMIALGAGAAALMARRRRRA